MLQRKHFKIIILSAIVMSVFYLFCVAPIDPYSDVKTSSQLLLKNSLREVDSLSIEDSIGKPVSIGMCRYLPKNIDSLQLKVTSKLSLTSTISITVLDTVFRFFNTSKTYDTLWKQITFTSAGEFLVETNAYTSLKTILSDSATINIHDRSNLPPKWETDTIKMNVFSGAAIFINLADTCVDPNNDQLFFSLLSGLPARDTIIGSLYRFTPLVADTGSFAIHIVASDPAQATDTLTIAMNVRIAPIDSIKPTYKLVKPNKDSISVNATSFKIDIIFTDASTIASVKCSTALALFPVEHTDSLYSAIVIGLQANVYNAITFVAIDGSSRANETRKTLYIKNDPLLLDLAGPILRRSLPNRDSIFTAVDSVAISIIATDQSGVASVACLLGTTALTVKKTDSVYSAVIKGLSSTATNRVYFVATDSSANKNMDTLTFYIKYEPTGKDHQKPTMNRKTPANDSTTVSSASTAISIVAKDLSGIASVVCSFGATTPAVTATDSIFSATVTGLVANQFNKIMFIATDASSSSNKETLFVTLKYDPTIADNSPPIFTKINGPTGPTVTTPAVSYEYAITDTNGIDSVYWTLNGTRQGYLSIDASEHYKLNATLSVQSNRIVIHAWDKSTNHNRDSVIITLNYTPSCIVRFDSKGGSAIDSQKVNSGDMVNKPADPTRTGYAFVGWYKEEAYTTKWNFGTDNVIANITLFAKWTINQYTVTFNTQGGTPVPAAQPRNYGDTVSTPNIPTYTGFTFGGWYKESSCATKWVLGTFKITQDTTLYAKWTTSTYMVTFNTNGGLPVPPTQTIKYYDTVVTPIATNKDSYTFDGWYKEATFATKWVFGTERITSNATLYAKWKIIQCMVTFNLQGGAGTIPSVSVDYNSTITKPLSDPTKLGYFFKTWVKDSVSANAWNFSSDKVTSDISVYAKWEIRDVEGNVYTEVKIGTQVWMVENLKTMKYNDGSALEDFIWYNNDISNKDKYGGLYGWGMIDPTNSKKIAPAGWHVPSATEWTTLQNYLIGNGYNYDYNTTGNKIGKAMASTSDWNYSDVVGTVGNSLATNNRSGFSAMPGGIFYNYTHQDFSGQGQNATWWSSTAIEGSDVGKISCSILYNSEAFTIQEDIKFYNYSIRLIKD
jgi:uncharacterized protein (TIGR02145 family)/uncharacterized repeat protein (TIGR02543 family)